MFKKTKTRVTSMAIGSAALVLLLGVTATLVFAFTPPIHVAFTLEGCRNDGTITLPIDGKYVCPDTAYTTGNLGKGWNELDLVPHRLTTQLGNQSGATTDYNVYVAADYQTSGHLGYDVISAPVVNAPKSDASCTISAGSQVTQGSAASPFGGGTDVVVYRELTIHQSLGTTCVFDYYERLALGAHLYSGSSLQSYMFDGAGLTGGKKTISIPVNEIKPQELNKDMSATQGTDHVWSITKGATPATLSFADTCDAAQPADQGVKITVTWTKGPADPSGLITVITHVYATNPAARVITTTVTDVIYSGTTALDTKTSDPIDVPANTASYLLLAHQFTVPAGTANLNDIATATYTDKATNAAIPGQTTAAASAAVQLSGPERNTSAIITDSESITGSGLKFSADAFTPGAGSFDPPYVAGAKTTGPAGWTSTSQTGNGSVTFDKTVYVAGPSMVNGTLSDTAVLTGSDGFSANAPLDVDISTKALVSLTIDKTIDVAQPADTTFNFKVKDGTVEVAAPGLTVKAGELAGSVTVPGLTPGVTYTISEEQKTGWKPLADQSIKIDLPTCSGSVSFANTAAKALTVSKTAESTFTRTFAWGIQKDVDYPRINIPDGGAATFQYTVAVTHDAGTDSLWKVAGTITVANPNDWLDVTADVTDALPGATCVVEGGEQVNVKAGSHVDLPYTCAFTGQPAYNTDLTNTATAAWVQATYGTLSGSASGEKTVQFTTPSNIVDGSVTVTDTQGGNLGAVSYTEGSPKNFTYTKDFSGVAGTCTDYNNTATFTTDTTGTTGSASQKVTACVGKDLTVSKTAAGTYDRTYQWSIDKAVDKTRINIAENGTAMFNYTVTVTPTGSTDSGWVLGGTITVTNPNDWEAITADITDAYDGGGVCTVTGGDKAVIPAGESVTLNYGCAFTTKPAYTGKNTATATWDKAAAFTPGGAASGGADVTIGLKGETHRTITVVDDKTTGAPVTLGTSDFYTGPFEFKYALEKQGVSGTCTDYTNTAAIQETGQSDTQTVTVCVGKDLTAAKTVTASLARTYKWLIDKSVDDTRIEIADGGKATFNYSVKVTPDGSTDSAWVLNGTITVGNPNDWEDITVNVADTLDQGGSCAITETAPYVVPKSGTLPLHYTCATDGTTTQNTATVTWDKGAAFTPNGTAAKDAAVSFAVGDEINKVITVVDDKTNPASPVTLGTWKWADGEHTFTYALDKQGAAGACTDYTNTAMIDETGQSDAQTVTVCVGKDLTVSKDAASTFTRAYGWNISKAVDRTTVDLEGTDPQKATFNYTVIVTHDAGTDSLWALQGNITVKNPNAWEDIVADVSDAAGGTTCAVTGGTGVSVPRNGEVTLSYTCAMPDGGSGANTATATWDKGAYFTPNASASGSANYSFTTPTTIVDGSVTVTDTMGGTLGTVSYTDPTPKTLTYAKEFQGVAGTCQQFDNTATFKTNTTETTGDSNKVTVRVCASVLNVVKLLQGAVDSSKDWQFSLYAGPHANDPMDSFGPVLASDTSLNKADGLMTFGNYNIDPAKAYTFCEMNAPVGWASVWTYDGNAIQPYNPDRFPTSGAPYGQDLGSRCFDFGAGTSYSIPTGGKITFQVDNRYPGGPPRTIGYWKNWSSCTGGKQMETAARNGGKDAGYWTLDDVLNPPGIMIGSFTIPAAKDTYTYTVEGKTYTPTGCEIAVALLGKRDAATGKNIANDAAYALAAQLIAAKANTTAGAQTCSSVGAAVSSADALLAKYGFNGSGTYLGNKLKGPALADRGLAIDLADTLDKYNNGMLCP